MHFVMFWSYQRQTISHAVLETSIFKMLNIKINKIDKSTALTWRRFCRKWKNKKERKLVERMKVNLKEEALKSPLLCSRSVTYHHMFYSSLGSWCSSTSDWGHTRPSPSILGSRCIYPYRHILKEIDKISLITPWVTNGHRRRKIFSCTGF